PRDALCPTLVPEIGAQDLTALSSECLSVFAPWPAGALVRPRHLLRRSQIPRPVSQGFDLFAHGRCASQLVVDGWLAVLGLLEPFQQPREVIGGRVEQLAPDIAK